MKQLGIQVVLWDQFNLPLIRSFYFYCCIKTKIRHLQRYFLTDLIMLQNDQFIIHLKYKVFWNAPSRNILVNPKNIQKIKCVCTLCILWILRHKISFDIVECFCDIFICLDISFSQFENEEKLLQLCIHIYIYNIKLKSYARFSSHTQMTRNL